eukprot:6228387-Amphidinium_carterae.1
MELHERVAHDKAGVVSGCLSIIQRVLSAGSRKFKNPYGELIRFKYTKEKKEGMKITIDLGFQGGKHTLKYDDWFMTSGWLLTSLWNFLNELVATHCASFRNAHTLFAWNKKGKMTHLEAGTHHFKFLTWFDDETGQPIPAYYYGKVEGDDLFGIRFLVLLPNIRGRD